MFLKTCQLTILVLSVLWVVNAGTPAPGPPPTNTTTNSSISCIFDVGGTTYDLSPLKTLSSTTPFSLAPANTSFVYTLSFCTPLTCSDSSGQSTNAASCRVNSGKNEDNGAWTSITADPLSSNFTVRGLQLTYNNGSSGCHGQRRTIVSVLCGSGDGAIIEAHEGIVPPEGGCTYYLQFQTKYVCSGGFGVGWILIILILSAAILYLIIGAIYNWRVKKATGKELVPNFEFWKNFPGYVKDGFLFTWYKLSCKKGEYQRLPS